MKGSKSRNIFAEISKEANEEKKTAAKNTINKEETQTAEQDTTINKAGEEEVIPTEPVATEEKTVAPEVEENPVIKEEIPVVEEKVTPQQTTPEKVEPTNNQGVLFITPTKKQTRHNRKGFLLFTLSSL